MKTITLESIQARWGPDGSGAGIGRMRTALEIAFLLERVAEMEKLFEPPTKGELKTATGISVEHAALEEKGIITRQRTRIETLRKLAEDRLVILMAERKQLKAARELVDRQMEDRTLWNKAKTWREGYLQQELRTLHAAVLA